MSTVRSHAVEERSIASTCGREARVNRDQGVSLQPGDREVLGLPEDAPVVLACELPCGAARHPVTEQPHLYRGHPLVCFQGRGFGALAGADVTQQQFERIGADGVRRDQMVGWMDLKPGVHEEEQSRCVDYVSGHQVSLTGPVRAQFPVGRHKPTVGSCRLPERPNVTKPGRAPRRRARLGKNCQAATLDS
jgi:hypothetical protein